MCELASDPVHHRHGRHAELLQSSISSGGLCVKQPALQGLCGCWRPARHLTVHQWRGTQQPRRVRVPIVRSVLQLWELHSTRYEYSNGTVMVSFWPFGQHSHISLLSYSLFFQKKNCAAFFLYTQCSFFHRNKCSRFEQMEKIRNGKIRNQSLFS